MQSACRHTNDPNTQASMHKGFIKECPFVRWHAAVFPSLAVEHEIRGDDGSTNDGGAIKELLSHAAGFRAHGLTTGLDVGTTESLLEGISRFGECGDGRNGL